MGHSFKTVRLQNEVQLQQCLADGLREVYRLSFAEPPWEEEFGDQEIDEILLEGFRHPESQLFVARKGKRVVAFGIGFPLNYHHKVAEHLSGCPDFDNAKAMYMADVAVHPDFRGQGLGQLMIDTRLRNLPDWCESVVMRTAREGSKSKPIYEKRNFNVLVGWDQLVMSKRLDGTERTDPRIFLHCRVADIVLSEPVY